MTTEELVEAFMAAGFRSYKKYYKNAELYKCLSRHKPIEIDGIVFTYWREFIVYQIGKYIKKMLPDAKVDVNLDGNNSDLELELTEEEQRTLNSKLFVFERNHNLV